MSLYLSDDIRRLWQDGDVWQQVRALEGEVYRSVEGRRTLRVELGGRHYFLKHHTGVGWREIFKNLLQLRAPVISAYNEWRAIHCLQGLDVPTMKIAAYGIRGLNPAYRESFILTEALDNTASLETLVSGWARQRPPFALKRRLIRAVAEISRRMHQAGMCHRDLYLCHFLLHLDRDGQVDLASRPRLSLIDLHRALVRPALGPRWVGKDIAALLFSSRVAGLSRTDLLRFVREYKTISLRRELIEAESFWQTVLDKASMIAARERRQLKRRVSRDGVAYGRKQSITRLVLYRQDMLNNTPELRNRMLSQPDQLMAQGVMLKDGDSTTVVRVELEGKYYVIKRYNITGLWHGLRRLFRPSRAWHCWLQAHYLRQAGIQTPTPVMMIERRWGWLRRQAWFVSEWQAGEDLLQVLQKNETEGDWLPVMDHFRALIHQLQRQYIVHGDMKLSNFVNTGKGLVLLDLDGLYFSRRGQRFARQHRKDLQRFLRNWEVVPALYKHAEGMVQAANKRLKAWSGRTEK